MTKVRKKKVGVRATVQVRAYTVVSSAVAAGVEYGWRRAHKHTDTPSPDDTQAAIETAVMDELCTVLDFDGGGGE